jgi:hypothetical protein
MAGDLVPTVLFPRFTTLSGAGEYTTVAMNVAEYAGAILSVWRGPLIGLSGVITFTFQESTDRETWTTCSGPTSMDPGEGTEAQVSPSFTKRWFRVRAELGGTDVSGTCWVLGSFESRES